MKWHRIKRHRSISFSAAVVLAGERGDDYANEANGGRDYFIKRCLARRNPSAFRRRLDGVAAIYFARWADKTAMYSLEANAYLYHQ